MPIFSYKAKDKEGKFIEGTLEAEHRNAVVNRLQTMGYFPVDIKDQTEEKKHSQPISRAFKKKISLNDLVNFNRQMADLIGSGVPLVKALNIMNNQITNEHLREIIGNVLQDVQDGDSMSYALSRHPRYFNKLYCSMVRAGERGGFLDMVMERLADLTEKEQEIASKIKATLAYPVIMIFATIIAIIILMTVVVPQIVKVFTQMEQVLPLPTQILINISWAISRYWWLIFAIIGGIVLLVWNFARTEEGKWFMDKTTLRIPLLGAVILKRQIGRFARTLSSLLMNGVPILEALEITKDVSTNKLVSKEIDKIIVEVTQGSSMARIMRTSDLFPAVMVNMIAVGEETARLPEVLGKVATSYETDVDRSIKMLTSLIEPLIILFMGVMVAFIVISMLLPIFTLDPTV